MANGLTTLHQMTGLNISPTNILLILDHFDDDKTFTSRYIEETNRLNERFLNKKKTHPWHGKLNVIVILMPLDSKRKLVSALHHKLKTIQSLGG